MDTVIGVTAFLLASRGIWLVLRYLWRRLKPHLIEGESGTPYAPRARSLSRQP